MQTVNFEIKVTETARRDGAGNTVTTKPTTTVQVTLGEKPASISETFTLPESGEIQIARKAAAAFVIAWVSNLRQRIEAGAVVATGITIAADQGLRSHANVELLIDGLNYRQPVTHEIRYKARFEVENAVSSSHARNQALLMFDGLLNLAYAECEHEAGASMPELLARFSRLSPRWLHEARVALGA